MTFGAADPVGATGIQADLATFAAMGCHGLSVVTSLLIGDTARVEDAQIVEVDWVADQARVILEDMAVSAFKVGAVGSIENISAIAEIVSDYPDVPLILDPFITSLSNQEEEEDRLIAIRELLVPQTTLMVVSAGELSRLAETWREPVPGDALMLDAMRIIEMGCEYLFVTNTQTDLQEIANSLFDESGLVRQDAWQRLPGSFTGAGSTLSAAIASMMANGLEVPEAVAEAQEFTLATLANAQRFGMGKLVPDRYFWARESENPDSPPTLN
nr:hydroxymethylpyrimidine/phosphomethylpyrimidine kinase [Herbaspirillum sp. LeCh32-8]